MIFPNEMRHLNWYEISGKPYQVKIDRQFRYYVHLSDGRTALLSSFNQLDVKPVTLNKEILDHAFTYNTTPGVANFDEEPNMDEDTHVWELSVKSSVFCDYFTITLIQFGNKYEGHYTFSCGDVRVRIKYLHQLQNLVWALTGKELEVDIK